MPSRSSSGCEWALGVLLGASLLLTAPASAGEHAAGDSAATAARVLAAQASVSKVRGLRFVRDVNVDIEDATTMRARMQRELDEQVDPEELAGTQVSWSLLGLTAPGFDIGASYMDILEENVGGYYDVEELRLVLVDRDMGGTVDSVDMLENMVTAHELVHALQDQHFDLWSLTRREIEDSDVALAIQALVEGDASYAMLYSMPFVDPDKLKTDQLALMMRQAGGPSDDMGGKLGAAPSIMRAPLLFPYTQGLLFAHAVKKSGRKWSGVDAAYAAPPLSTEQILHPEKYVGDTPDWPTRYDADADGWLGGTWKLVDADTLGEMGVGLLLQEHGVSDADAAAAGWDGDRYWTFQDGDQACLVWRSTWDSEAEAGEFAAAAAKVTTKLRPNAEKGAPTSGVRQQGSDVLVWLDVPRSRREKLLRTAAKVPSREIRSLDDVAPLPDPRSTPAP